MVAADFLLSPRIPIRSAMRGERPGEGGTLPADFRISQFVVHSMLVGTKREFGESKAFGPLTLALSPNTQNV